MKEKVKVKQRGQNIIRSGISFKKYEKWKKKIKRLVMEEVKGEERGGRDDGSWREGCKALSLSLSSQED